MGPFILAIGIKRAEAKITLRSLTYYMGFPYQFRRK
jgi:hypothetical protein